MKIVHLKLIAVQSPGHIAVVPVVEHETAPLKQTAPVNIYMTPVGDMALVETIHTNQVPVEP